MREETVDLHEIADKAVDAALYQEGFEWKEWFEGVVDPENKEEVALLWHQMKRLASALKGLTESISEDLAVMLKEQGSVSFGDALIYARSKRSEKVIDTLAFEDWLEKNPHLAKSLFNPNQVRFGQLPPAVRDTFFETKILDGIEVVEASKEWLG